MFRTIVEISAIKERTNEGIAKDIELSTPVSLSHWNNLAWERTSSVWSPNSWHHLKLHGLKKFFRQFISGQNGRHQDPRLQDIQESKCKTSTQLSQILTRHGNFK
ncbi:hypothetical protein TNCV_1443201 [Trichonephila clavipes]|nr:hypothetical protein TNCV_1443201 [Trichonephila clavipes]